MFERRNGEQALAFDPGTAPGDGHIVFIGHVDSPWTDRETCPRNLTRAREAGKAARVVVDAPYRPGLGGLEGATHVVLLTWLHHSPRDLIVQHPRHAKEAKGVFALRSPARPNPIGLHVVRVTGLDIAAGILELDAIDVLDGTPVLDVKPYIPAIDAVPDARTGRAGSVS